jgi:hypothetical protein
MSGGGPAHTRLPRLFVSGVNRSRGKLLSQVRGALVGLGSPTVGVGAGRETAQRARARPTCPGGPGTVGESGPGKADA